MQQIGFLGADVSKGMCNFVLIDEKGKELEPNFQLDDNRDGHKTLKELLLHFKTEHLLKRIVVGVESTGGYENNWYNNLRSQSKKLGIEIYRINPKRIYHESKTEGRRSINDGVSARVIAGYLRKNYGAHNSVFRSKKKKENAEEKGMLNLHKYIKRIITQRTRTKNALEKILYQTMPELLAIKREGYPNWFLELIIKYPSRKSILSAGLQGITKIKYISETKGRKILDALDQSVGWPADLATKMALREQAQDIRQFDRKVKRLQKQLVKMASKPMKSEIDILCSLRGIAEDTAVGLLLHLGSIDNFEKSKSLVAYWGVNPTLKQSGDKTYKSKMSKAGNSSARSVLFIAAENVVMHEPYFKALYAKQRSKGKNYYAAMGVIMSKLARVIFGMLKNHSVFDAGVDQYNQTKKTKEILDKKETEVQTENKGKERRHQKVYQPAPISGRQKKKRKQEYHVPN